jgi:peptide subunit release factor 1 (eRF1)
MISREELRQLAGFECQYPKEHAVSFYFQPSKPQDKSHREETIFAKDLIRKTIQELQLNGRNRQVVEDLERILRLAEGLHGNQARAKAVFACAARQLWREFDLPPTPGVTRLFVNRRFHLKPLAPVFSEHPRLWLALIDRQTARFLEVQFDRINDQGSMLDPVPRHGRSDGYLGYDAGHLQRHTDDEVRRHYVRAAEFLKDAAERKQYEALVICCHEVNWPDLQSQLHPYVQKKVLGRFSGDFGTLTNEKAAEETRRILHDSLQRHHQALVSETLSEAKSNGRGVTGLRRVLRATEQGEVETIIMGQDYSARAVECTNCRHLDSHCVPYCPVCGHATRSLDDVCEALVPAAVKNNIGLVLVPQDDALDRVGNIAALLRFRADRNRNQMLAAS